MATKSVIKKDKMLLIEYEPEFGFVSFDEFIKTCEDYEKDGRSLILNRTFHIKKENIVNKDEDDFPAYILIGRKDETESYYRLDRNVFNIAYDVYFDANIPIKLRYLAHENTSVIGYLSRTINSDIYIDADKHENSTNHIPVDRFEECIVRMPTRYELSKYKDKVTEQLFQDFFESVPDYKSKYETYVNKLRNVDDYSENMPKAFYSFKIEEYKSILHDLKSMLNDKTLSEKQWQNKIIDIIKIVFPKYLYIFPSVSIISLGDKKQLDFLAIDNQGHVDVIEIKKAEIGKLLRLYRDNYSPTKELAGSFTQVEKYIYFLASDKERLENKLNSTFRDKIGNLIIKIVNPQGVIIAGRGNNMSELEKNDFEIVRKAHKDISDVITYDELITRLENTIMAFENKKTKTCSEDDNLPF